MIEDVYETKARQAIPTEDEAFSMDITSKNAPAVTNIGGIMEMKSLEQTLREEEEASKSPSEEPVIAELARYILSCWSKARDAKEGRVLQRMLSSLRQRNGEYDPEVLAELKEQKSTAVYMMLTSNKCRSASAWVREAYGTMPWSCEPTPVSDIDTSTQEAIISEATTKIQQTMQMGVIPTDADVRAFMMAVRDQAFAKVQTTAKERADRMTEKMKDQLIEGRFNEAIDEFIEDLVTFPAAFLKGPIIKVRPQLKWVPGMGGKLEVAVEDTYKLEWARVSPFNIYPAPDATNIDDGFLFEHHKLSREDLSAFRSIEGFDAEAINEVLITSGVNGKLWIDVDSTRDEVEGKANTMFENASGLIDALQFWGSVQGQMLIDWGMSAEEVSDPQAEYHIEAWIIGRWVIKCTVNPDPLHRKPYYKTSWENIPGSFWGKAIPDLCRDTQKICNAAARALVSNMAIASGPQIVVNVSQLPPGEDITEMYPWKIWQVVDGYNGGNQPPVSFFNPNSNSSELMAVYDKFSALADEYTGIPRYMTGDSPAGGAGRTASGMSMLMTNAGKSIKNVIASIDRIMRPAIERLYFYNMQYLDDPELKGDVSIVVKGATSLVQQQAQQQRTNEILNIVSANPVLTNIIGMEGIAYLLREVVKAVGIDTDQIVPSLPIIKAKKAQEAMMQQQMMMQQMMAAQQAQGNPEAGGSKANPMSQGDKRQLMDGSAQVNTSAV